MLLLFCFSWWLTAAALILKHNNALMNVWLCLNFVSLLSQVSLWESLPSDSHSFSVPWCGATVDIETSSDALQSVLLDQHLHPAGEAFWSFGMTWQQIHTSCPPIVRVRRDVAMPWHLSEGIHTITNPLANTDWWVTLRRRNLAYLTWPIFPPVYRINFHMCS